MKKIKVNYLVFPISILLNMIVFFGLGKAQDSSNIPTDVYGMDPLLYNGRYYNFLVANDVIGTPFLNSADFIKGSVTIRGVTFNDLDLNYDLFNQQLVLKFKNSLGSLNIIVLSNAWLEAFTLGNMQFRAVRTADTTVKYYRVMGTGPVFLYSHLSKRIALENLLGSRNYLYTDALKKDYLTAGDRMLQYTGNKSFISFFTDNNQVLIRKFIRQHKIRVKKAPEQKMTELINYCNSL